METTTNPQTTTQMDSVSSQPTSKRSRESLDSSGSDREVLMEQLKFLTNQVSQLCSTVEFLVKEIATLKQAQGPLTFKEALNKPLATTGAGKASEIAPKQGKNKLTSSMTSPPTSAPAVQNKGTEIPAAWTTVGPKKIPRKIPSNTLTEDLKKVSTKEEKLKLLLKKSISPDQRSDLVASLMVKLPLSNKAQKTPVSSWKSAMLELTGHQPLAISIVHPCKAEVFFDGNVIDSVANSLRSEDYLCPDEPLTDKDLSRRKSSYLQGYFRPLRRVMLQGFSKAQQLKVLELAEISSKTIFTDPQDRKKWKNHCLKDREWIQLQDTTVDDPDDMSDEI
jgi:hypothetical protein